MNIDWMQVTNNLRAYKPLSQVARETGIDAQHLYRLSRGEVDQPKWNTGIKLLDLHFDKCCDKHTEELITRVYK